jgi:hypothetical protein
MAHPSRARKQATQWAFDAWLGRSLTVAIRIIGGTLMGLRWNRVASSGLITVAVLLSGCGKEESPKPPEVVNTSVPSPPPPATTTQDTTLPAPTPPSASAGPAPLTVPAVPETTKAPELVEIAPAAEVPLAEDFDSGHFDVSTIELPRLVAFRKDLAARRAYDISQHDDKPTDTTPFFDGWITKVDKALADRGCVIKEDGAVAGPR